MQVRPREPFDLLTIKTRLVRNDQDNKIWPRLAVQLLKLSNEIKMIVSLASLRA